MGAIDHSLTFFYEIAESHKPEAIRQVIWLLNSPGLASGPEKESRLLQWLPIIFERLSPKDGKTDRTREWRYTLKDDDLQEDFAVLIRKEIHEKAGGPRLRALLQGKGQTPKVWHDWLRKPLGSIISDKDLNALSAMGLALWIDRRVSLDVCSKLLRDQGGS